MRGRPQRRSRGFTLLEIMVALAILAVGMSALVRVAGDNVSNAAYLKSKTFAQWVAANKVNEIQIQRQWPATGTQSGRLFYAEVEWYWQVKTLNTQDRDIRRIEVSVQQETGRNGDPLVVLSAFVARPR
ncbi:MAG: type II secretion system minor pseudopilin GspI [Gammaproteobacteria bacterium]